MDWNVLFFLNSVLLGVGLAMDAFSVSMANGLNEPRMKPGRMGMIAGCYGMFQIVMPLAGWLCVHTIVRAFSRFERLIPWIALILLGYIGGKMLLEGVRGHAEEEDTAELGTGALLMQGIATSIDALSVGFTISDYGFVMALVCSLIIGVTTFILCMIGLEIGRTVGNRLAGRASILGGVILIAIGIEIFVSNLL